MAVFTATELFSPQVVIVRMRGHLGEKLRKSHIGKTHLVLDRVVEGKDRPASTRSTEEASTEKDSLVNPILPTGGVGEPKLLSDANDLPGDGLKEDEVVGVMLSDLSVHKVVPGS